MTVPAPTWTTQSRTPPVAPSRGGVAVVVPRPGREVATSTVPDVTVPGGPPLRRTVLVDVNGTTVADLADVVHGPIVRTLGDHDAASFTIHLSHPDLALIAGSSATKLREVQLWRGTQLWCWGPIVDATLSGATLTCAVAGASWHLTRRRVGPAVPTERLTNPSFESNFTGWTFVETDTAGTSFTTAPTPTTSTDANPPQQVVRFAFGGVSQYSGSYALRLYGKNLGEGDGGDLFGVQEVTVNGGARGLRATLTGRVWYSTPLYTRHPNYFRGLMLGLLPTDYDTTTVNSGKLGWLTDLEVWEATRIDDTTPRDRWVEQSVSIDVKPNQSKVLHVRLCAPNGLIQFDDLSLTFDDALELQPQSQLGLVGAIVAHAQSATFGKTNANLTVDGDASGPLRQVVALHAEKAVCWDLIQNLVRLEDGIDVATRYTPTTRTIVVSQPRAGSVRSGALALWMPGNVASLDSWSFSGGSAATVVSVQADGESARFWGTASDVSGFADSQVHETVVSGSIEAESNDLNADAEEFLSDLRAPESFTVTLNPDQTDAYLATLEVGDWLPVNIKVGNLSIVGTYRCVAVELTPDDLLRLSMNARTSS